MKFRVDNQIFESFPGLNLGIVVAERLDNTGINKEVINLIKEKQEEIRAKFDRKTLSQEPKIDAWRKAYSSFGAKPKKYKCSVENLYKMTLEGVELRHINKVVDIYNYISLKHMIPVGGDDADKVDGDIVLKFAKGEEPFTELNSEETKNPREGEVVYVDDKEVLCRRWNWRECDKSKMTEHTKRFALVVEGLPPFTKQEVEKIIKELGELVKKFCGGEVKTFLISKEEKEVEF